MTVATKLKRLKNWFWYNNKSNWRWYIHPYIALRWGQWSCGFESRKTWPGKAYLYCGTIYYDGYHWVFHLWWFYLTVYY